MPEAAGSAYDAEDQQFSLVIREDGYKSGRLCLVQVGNGIELEAVGFRFEPYRWRPCGVTWDSSRTVVVIKLRRTSALLPNPKPLDELIGFFAHRAQQAHTTAEACIWLRNIPLKFEVSTILLPFRARWPC